MLYEGEAVVREAGRCAEGYDNSELETGVTLRVSCCIPAGEGKVVAFFRVRGDDVLVGSERSTSIC